MSRTRLLLLIVYVLLIFFVSTRANLDSPGPEFALKDKIAHLTEYSVLGALMFAALGRSIGGSRSIAFILLVALGASVGAVDEILQSYVPGRSMDVFDWIADVVGVATGATVLIAARSRRPRPGVGTGGGSI